MKGGDRFFERMTVIVTMNFTIFMIIRIGYLRIGLLTPHHVRMIGLFSFVTHRYCIAEYMKVLEGDRDMLIRYPLFPSNDFSLRF